MKKLDLKGVQVVNEQLQGIDASALVADEMALYNAVVWCASQKAYTGEQMAIAKKAWMDAKKSSYVAFIADNEANQRRVENYGVMVVKDFIAAKCGDMEAAYQYTERTNNACGSMEDALRTVISSLKEEKRLSMVGNYAGG